MTETFPLPVPVVRLHRLPYFSLSAACGEGVSGGGQQVVDMGRDSGH